MLVLPSLFELCLGLLELAPRRLGLNSANSGKGERQTSLPLSALPFLGIFDFLSDWVLVATSGARWRSSLLFTRRSRGWPVASARLTPLVQNLAFDEFKALPNGFLAPPPCGPFSWPWRLCLGRGSGGAPFCFAVLFHLFPPLRLVRCSRAELSARAFCGKPYWLKLIILISRKWYLDCGAVSGKEQPAKH